MSRHSCGNGGDQASRSRWSRRSICVSLIRVWYFFDDSRAWSLKRFFKGMIEDSIDVGEARRIELVECLRQYFRQHTADISNAFTVHHDHDFNRLAFPQISANVLPQDLPNLQVPVWRGSKRERRLLERLGVVEAADAYHRGTLP